MDEKNEMYADLIRKYEIETDDESREYAEAIEQEEQEEFWKFLTSLRYAQLVMVKNRIDTLIKLRHNQDI